MSKMQKVPFKEVRRRTERSLQIIHTDTMGPIKPTSHPERKRFINVYIDDYTRLARAFPINSKDESGESLEKYLIFTRNLLGEDAKVCYIRADRGTEFTGGKFLELSEREKIEIEFTPPYTPEHNGVAKRFNATIQRKVRAYMFDSELPKSMWDLAVEAAVHTYNRTPHKSIEYQIPLIKFSPNKNCHFEKIKRFGCIWYVKIRKPSLKFGERAIKAVLVGYKSNDYLLWHSSSGKFIESKHLKFNEKLVYKDVYRNNHLEKIKKTECTKEEIIDWNWMKEFKGGTAEKIEKTEPKKRGRPCKKTKELEETDKGKRVEEKRKPNTRSTTKRKLEIEENNEIQNARRLIEDINYIRYTNILDATVRK